MIEEPITQLLADIAISLRRGPNIDGEHPIHTTAEDLAAVLDAAEAMNRTADQLVAAATRTPVVGAATLESLWLTLETALARWRELGGGR